MPSFISCTWSFWGWDFCWFQIPWHKQGTRVLQLSQCKLDQLLQQPLNLHKRLIPMVKHHRGKVYIQPAVVISLILHGASACNMFWGKDEMAHQAVACKHRTAQIQHHARYWLKWVWPSGDSSLECYGTSMCSTWNSSNFSGTETNMEQACPIETMSTPPVHLWPWSFFQLTFVCGMAWWSSQAAGSQYSWDKNTLNAYQPISCSSILFECDAF